jgi:hypothetical protein
MRNFAGPEAQEEWIHNADPFPMGGHVLAVSFPFRQLDGQLKRPP